MNIHDIARIAGVSTSTVSRVVNSKPGVGKRKRELIEAIIREHNFQPDETARSLVTQSTRTIGILTDDLNSRRQNEGIARIENEIMSAGYQCFMKYIGEREDAIEQGIADLARRRVEGALLLGVRFRNHALLAEVLRRYLADVPVVLMYQTERIDMDNVYCVGADERRGFAHCIDRLYDAGRRYTALLIDLHRASEKQIQCYVQEAVARHPDMTCRVYTGIVPRVTSGMEAMRRILQEYPQVDSILSAQDAIAIGAMYECLDRGIAVPGQISVIGEDNSAACEACRPTLSSLDTMILATSNNSVRLLLDVLSGRACSHKMVLDMELVERESI